MTDVALPQQMLPSARLVAAAVVPSPKRQALMQSWWRASLLRLCKLASPSLPSCREALTLLLRRQR